MLTTLGEKTSVPSLITTITTTHTTTACLFNQPSFLDFVPAGLCSSLIVAVFCRLDVHPVTQPTASKNCWENNAT